MVISCSAYGCTNRQGMKRGRSFYRFPKDPERRAKWIAALKRANWQPTETSRICSEHFASGQKDDNPLSPDYVPSVFDFLSSPRKRKQLERAEDFDRRREAKRRRREENDRSSSALPRLCIQDSTNRVQEHEPNPLVADKLNAANMAVTAIAVPVTSSRCQKRKRPENPLKSLVDPQLLAPELLTVQGKYLCSVCKETFASLAQLARHVQFHDGDRQFPCDVCGKRFLSRSHHDEHQRVHTGERPFPCIRCGRSFTTHHNLKRHLMTHDKEEAYRCTVCSVLFCQDPHLNNLKGIVGAFQQHENPKGGHVMTNINPETTNPSNKQEENVKNSVQSQSEEDCSSFAEDQNSNMSINSDFSQVPSGKEAHVLEALNEATLRIKRIAYDMEFVL